MYRILAFVAFITFTLASPVPAELQTHHGYTTTSRNADIAAVHVTVRRNHAVQVRTVEPPQLRQPHSLTDDKALSQHLSKCNTPTSHRARLAKRVFSLKALVDFCCGCWSWTRRHQPEFDVETVVPANPNMYFNYADRTPNYPFRRRDLSAQARAVEKVSTPTILLHSEDTPTGKFPQLRPAHDDKARSLRKCGKTTSTETTLAKRMFNVKALVDFCCSCWSWSRQHQLGTDITGSVAVPNHRNLFAYEERTAHYPVRRRDLTVLPRSVEKASSRLTVHKEDTLTGTSPQQRPERHLAHNKTQDLSKCNMPTSADGPIAKRFVSFVNIAKFCCRCWTWYRRIRNRPTGDLETGFARMPHITYHRGGSVEGDGRLVMGMGHFRRRDLAVKVVQARAVTEASTQPTTVHNEDILTGPSLQEHALPNDTTRALSTCSAWTSHNGTIVKRFFDLRSFLRLCCRCWAWIRRRTPRVDLERAFPRNQNNNHHTPGLPYGDGLMGMGHFRRRDLAVQTVLARPVEKATTQTANVPTGPSPRPRPQRALHKTHALSRCTTSTSPKTPMVKRFLNFHGLVNFCCGCLYWTRRNTYAPGDDLESQIPPGPYRPYQQYAIAHSGRTVGNFRRRDLAVQRLLGHAVKASTQPTTVHNEDIATGPSPQPHPKRPLTPVTANKAHKLAIRAPAKCNTSTSPKGPIMKRVFDFKGLVKLCCSCWSWTRRHQPEFDLTSLITGPSEVPSNTEPRQAGSAPPHNHAPIVSLRRRPYQSTLYYNDREFGKVRRRDLAVQAVLAPAVKASTQRTMVRPHTIEKARQLAVRGPAKCITSTLPTRPIVKRFFNLNGLTKFCCGCWGWTRERQPEFDFTSFISPSQAPSNTEPRQAGWASPLAYAQIGNFRRRDLAVQARPVDKTSTRSTTHSEDTPISTSSQPRVAVPGEEAHQLEARAAPKCNIHKATSSHAPLAKRFVNFNAVMTACCGCWDRVQDNEPVSDQAPPDRNDGHVHDGARTGTPARGVSRNRAVELLRSSVNAILYGYSIQGSQELGPVIGYGPSAQTPHGLRLP